jgi:hypothetical protein
LVAAATCTAITSGVIASVASAPPGNLTLADCSAHLAGCNLALFYGGTAGKTLGVAVNGLHVYTVAPAAIHQFNLDSSGKLGGFANCYCNSGTICDPSPCISGRVTDPELALRDVPAPAELAGMPGRGWGGHDVVPGRE